MERVANRNHPTLTGAVLNLFTSSSLPGFDVPEFPTELDTDLLDDTHGHLLLPPGANDVAVMVFEDEPGSIIAYAMASQR